MILDLNVASFAESSLAQKKLLHEGSNSSQMADSVSSNSAVLNAEDSSNIADEDSSPLCPAFRFGILNDGVDFESGLVVHQLFPQQPQGFSEWLRPGAAIASSLSREPWQDLSVCQADAPATGEVKLLHPQQQKLQVKKSRRGPRSRSSQYRGVTFYRRTGRWESHIWDCGKQVYLGGFDTAHDAARVYDRAAIKFRGVDADINFNLSDYEKDFKQMRNLTKEEFVLILRHRSTGFSRGSSKYRGVGLQKFSRCEAHMGQLLCKKVYDKVAINCNGKDAVTNFQQSTYKGDLLPKDDGEAFGHGIDLNLSISQPSVCCPKRNVYSVCQQLYYSSFEASAHVKHMPAHPLAVAPDHQQALSNTYQGFFPVSEDRPMNKKNETGLENPWKIHGFSPLPLRSFAASSGFSFTSTAAKSSTQPAQPPLATAPYHLQLGPRSSIHQPLH